MYVAKAGLTLQGRYFLPVAIGLSAVAVHRNVIFSSLLLATLIAFNAAFMHRTIERYYAKGLPTFYESLPFRAPTMQPVEMIHSDPVVRSLEIRKPDEYRSGPNETGFIDRITRKENSLEIEGWIKESDKTKEQTIMLYLSDSPLSSEVEARERPDVVDTFKDPALLQSGFIIRLQFLLEDAAIHAEKELCFAFRSAQNKEPTRLQFGSDAWRCRS